MTNGSDHAICLSFNNDRSKEVYQYDLAGNFMKKWDNANVVYTDLGIKDSSIGRCCKNQRGGVTAGGFRWSYKLYDQLPIRQKNYTFKIVYQYDRYGNFIKSFTSLKELSNCLNLDYKQLSRKVRKEKEIGGFTYSYKCKNINKI